MKIYNVLINDRHTDPEIHSFTEKSLAIIFAENIALEYCRYPQDLVIKNENELQPGNWILDIQYSCEGDYVRVLECELEETTEYET